MLPHKSENLVITPKGNIGSQSPKVIDDPSVIRIENKERKYPLAINIDGTLCSLSQQDEDIAIEIVKSSQKVALLISKHHLTDWDNKVLEEQGFTS